MCSCFCLFTFCVIVYQGTLFVIRALHYAAGNREFLHQKAQSSSEFAAMARENGVQFQVEYFKEKKMVLASSLLCTRYYKVRIKGKVEQSIKRISALPNTLV